MTKLSKNVKINKIKLSNNDVFKVTIESKDSDTHSVFVPPTPNNVTFLLSKETIAKLYKYSRTKK